MWEKCIQLQMQWRNSIPLTTTYICPLSPIHNMTIVSIGIAYRHVVQREWEVNRWLRWRQAAICLQQVSRVIPFAFRYDNGPSAGQSWNIIISQVPLIVIVERNLKCGANAVIGAVFLELATELIQYSSANEEPVMSPALCASSGAQWGYVYCVISTPPSKGSYGRVTVEKY